MDLCDDVDTHLARTIRRICATNKFDAQIHGNVRRCGAGFKLQKIRSFLDSGVPLNYTFRTSHFPDFRGPDRCKWRKNGRILKKTAEISDRRKSGIMLRPSIQPIIKFIFSPHFVGFLETWDMRQRETPFCFSNFETKQKNWDFHMWNQDTSRFVLKNRDIRIKSG